MAPKPMPKLIVFGDPEKGDVNAAIDEFVGFADGRAEIMAICGIDQCKLPMLEATDYAVVFGGDGSIISVARQLSMSHVPVIGVNLGKLGYLAEFSLEEAHRHLDDILAGKAAIEKRMMLSCRVFSDGQKRFSSAAINEVFFTAGPPYGMIELQMCIDGQKVAGCLADGLIISTPTGSTAYNLSAGGPILSGNLEAVVITAVCPHSLSYRPIVISSDKKVEVRGISVNEGTTISVDGQVATKLNADDIVVIERLDGQFLIVNNPERTQWDTLATKLRWAEKPMYKKSDK